ncbi:MAG TPA: hypothetical protein VJ436_13050 [Anaerolineales bacterium]|nr:hypothetical protein [Anaerolineales bacterium]
MDLITALLLAIVCLAIGFLLAGLVNSLRGRQDSGPAAPGGAVRQRTAAQTGERLWRDPAGQGLWVELDGQRFQQPAGLTSGQRDRLGKLASDLVAWIEPAPASGSTETQAAAQLEFTQPPAWDEDWSPSEAGLHADRSPTGAWQPWSQPPVEPVDLSIAAQIDAILQANLEGTPLAKRGVRLVELPDQEVVLMIGLEKYTDLEAIPDLEVRAAIRAAVAEWENRHTG